jgi:hypothetical protein
MTKLRLKKIIINYYNKITHRRRNFYLINFI